MNKNKVNNIEITHIDRNGYNSIYCFDDCIATIANRECVDYQLMYLDMGNIVFDFEKAKKEKKVISGLLVKEQGYSEYNYLEKMHGLKIKDYFDLPQEQLISIIKGELLTEKVVMVRLDSYYCEWDVLYQKEHTKHLGLCIGLDSNTVLLCDPFYGLDSIEMDIPSFVKANHGRISIYEINNNASKLSQLSKNEVLKDYIDRNIFENRINNLMSLANAYGTVFDYETEYSDFEEALKSFDIILDIVVKTSKFYNLLKYIRPVDESVQCLMDEVVGSWVVVKNTLFKGFFKRKNDVGIKIQKRIIEIAEKEKKIFDYYCTDMCLQTKDKEFLAVDSVKELNASGIIRSVYIDTVDIAGMLDNNSFGDYNNNECNADFTGLNEFLQYDDIDNTIKIDENFMVHTYISSENRNDNLVCEGQIIEVNNKNLYERVGILCVSEFGESIEVIKLMYSDDSQQKLHIKVTDVNDEPLFGEKIVWRGVTYQKDDNGVATQRLNNAHLFWVEFKIKRDSLVSEIILPDCSNLHIYGIYFMNREFDLNDI